MVLTCVRPSLSTTSTLLPAVCATKMRPVARCTSPWSKAEAWKGGTATEPRGVRATRYPPASTCLWHHAYRASYIGVSSRIFSWSSSPWTMAKPKAIAFRPLASGTMSMSAATSAPCTICARRSRPRSWRPYLTMIDSKLQRPSTWPSSTSFTSYGMAPSRSATAGTSSTGTYRNSASASTNRRISHGHATRSTLAFFRVTHFITSLLASRLFGPVGAARPPAGTCYVTYAAYDMAVKPVCRWRPSSPLLRRAHTAEGRVDEHVVDDLQEAGQEERQRKRAGAERGAAEHRRHRARGGPGHVRDARGRRALVRIDDRHGVGPPRRHVHLRHAHPRQEQEDGQPGGRRQRHQDQEQVGRQVREDHRVQQPDPTGQPAASSETPESTPTQKKTTPNAAGERPQRTWNQ